jgi:hypothetical protein
MGLKWEFGAPVGMGPVPGAGADEVGIPGAVADGSSVGKLVGCGGALDGGGDACADVLAGGDSELLVLVEASVEVQAQLE